METVENKLSVHFSSRKIEWSTPQDVFDSLNIEFGFTTDVCSTHENAKCENHYTIEEDGLSRKWTGVCWCNPPYARNVMAKWVRKAYDSSLSGATVVCLIPARTDTKMWHNYIWDKSRHEPRKDVQIRYVEGRLKFSGCKDSAPFPSAVVIFRPKGING